MSSVSGIGGIERFFESFLVEEMSLGTAGSYSSSTHNYENQQIHHDIVRKGMCFLNCGVLCVWTIFRPKFPLRLRKTSIEEKLICSAEIKKKSLN